VAIVKEIDVATTATPKFTVSLEKGQSPLERAVLEALKPTFLIRTDFFGDYLYAPYGETGGSWIIPLILGLLIWMALRRR